MKSDTRIISVGLPY